MKSPRLDRAIVSLAQQFSMGFPEALTGARTVGREAEFPVVTATGEAADVRRLWAHLLEGGDLTPVYGPSSGNRADFIVALKGAEYSYALEVGVGTVEVNSRPCNDLLELQDVMEHAVARLVRAAGRLGWRVLAYGIQPVTAPNLALMAPKQRYQSLYRAMGAQWLWYTVTASDQLHVRITRGEMVHMLNFGNLITPVLIALCANSPVFGGQISPFCSAREGQMADIYALEHRHGMTARPLKDMIDFVETLSQSTYLILRDDNVVIPSSDSFTRYLDENGPDLDAFLFHEHYIWNSARLRAAFGTMEIRPACQQPWPDHMAVAALCLGLVEASKQIFGYIRRSLGEQYWPLMRTYHRQAIRHGLSAPQPAPDFLEQIVTMAQGGLQSRGFGEEKLLDPVFKRLHQQRNPGQTNRAVFSRRGINGLLANATIRPTVRPNV